MASRITAALGSGYLFGFSIHSPRDVARNTGAKTRGGASLEALLRSDDRILDDLGLTRRELEALSRSRNLRRTTP
jgi:uncharacterized protein YjiS (DUF1127 family)